MKIAMVSVFLLLTTSNSWSFETGKDFLKECEPSSKKVFTQLTETEQLLAMSCGGYIRGFVGAIRVTEARTQSMIVCSPENVEIGQALRLTVKWMSDHPEELGRPAVQLIFTALIDSFPCSKDPERDEEQDAPPSKQDKTEEHDKLSL